MAKRIPFVASLGLVLALLAAFGLSACNEKIECAPGTVDRDGTCVAICEQGTEHDPTTGACVPACVPGTERDSATGACVPTNARCVSGEVWEPDTEQCLPVDGLCASGAVWAASEARCVPRQELRVPDQFESGIDNQWGPEATCEEFELPAAGFSWSLGGVIGPPDPQAYLPPMNCWNFVTEGPTMLRIHVDGYGGLAPAFEVVLHKEGPASHSRHGAGTSSAAITRDLFLPYSGRHALVVTDVMHMVPGGASVRRGSEDFEYYVEIEHLPIPEPEELSGTGIIKRGRWEADLPAGGTSLGVYEVPVEEYAVMHLDLHWQGWEILPLFVGVAPDGTPMEACAGDLPVRSSAEQDGSMLIVIDYSWWFSGQGIHNYTITREPQQFDVMGEGISTWQVHRPAWSPPDRMPATYYGFEVKAGDVYRVALKTSTGFTCFSIWEPTFTRAADGVGCFFISTPYYEHEINFISETDGLWILEVMDWSQGNWVDGHLLSLPARDFEFEVGIFPQTPLDLGDLGEPVATTEQLTEERPTRWMILSPSAEHQAFSLEVSSGEISPLMQTYYISPALAAPLLDMNLTRAASHIMGVPDGKTRLIAVSDEDSGTGSFELRAERHEPLRLDIPVGGDSLVTTTELIAGEVRHFEVLSAKPSDLHLTVTPPEGVAVAFMPAFDDYRDAPGYMQGAAPAGEPLEVVQGVAPIPFAFQLVDELGRPFEEDVELQIEARLVPLSTEQEPNDLPEEATLLPLDTPVAGERSHLQDIDWYRIDVSGPATLEVSTRPLGMAGLPSAHFTLFDEDLQYIFGLENIGHQLHPLVEVPVTKETTIFVRVSPSNRDGYGYVIEARASTN